MLGSWPSRRSDGTANFKLDLTREWLRGATERIALDNLTSEDLVSLEVHLPGKLIESLHGALRRLPVDLLEQLD